MMGPFDAYATDLGRISGRAVIGDRDAEWLLVAHVLWRIAQAPPLERATWAETPFIDEVAAAATADGMPEDATTPARRLGLLAANGHGEALLNETLPIVRAMEDVRALALGRLVVSTARLLAPGASPRARGLAMVVEARILRALGEFDAATDLFTDVDRLGTRTREPELRASAHLGLGGTAYMRGDYPQARSLFGKTIRIATESRLPEVLGKAHQGLMVAAAVARDFDTALVHGWTAFELAGGDAVRESEILLNLAGICLDTDQNAAALAGYLRAAERATADRVRFQALAWAGVAAARLGDRDTLNWCTGAVEQAAVRAGLPFQTAELWRALAEAWLVAATPLRAADFAVRGLKIARDYQLHEITFHLTRLEKAARSALDATDRTDAILPRATAPSFRRNARTVIRHLEALAAA